EGTKTERPHFAPPECLLPVDRCFFLPPPCPFFLCPFLAFLTHLPCLRTKPFLHGLGGSGLPGPWNDEVPAGAGGGDPAPGPLQAADELHGSDGVACCAASPPSTRASYMSLSSS